MIDGDIQKEIKEMREKGSSISRIARELGLSRPTVLKYLYDHSTSKVSHHTPPSISKKVIPVDPPSQRIRDRRDDAEIVSLEIERQKGLRELEKVIGSQISPELQKKKDDLEIKKINVEEFETDHKLKALTDEERRKARIEEEEWIQREIERQWLAEEQVRLEKHQKWVQELQDWSLLRGISLPWGFSLSTKAKFEVRDAVKKALETRSENGDEIRKLIREIAQATIQPYIDRFEEDKRIEKTKQEAAELERKEKEAAESKARVEKIKREREEREAKEKAFREKVKKEREEENEKERIEDLVRAGTNRLYTYLAINRKDLKTVSLEEQQRARKHLERGLREEIEGTETDREVEKIADEILDDFFFE